MSVITEKYYGKVLKYNSRLKGEELKSFYRQLPSRKEFIDKDLNRQINADIAASRPVYFMPTNTFETHLKEYSGGRNGMVYRLCLTGTLQCGSAAVVILEDIDVFIDAKIPDDADHDMFMDSMRARLEEYGAYPSKIEKKFMRPFKYYQEGESPYLRLYFRTLYQRKKAYNLLSGGEFEYGTLDATLKKSAIETASNDNCFTSQASKQGTVYYRKAAREYKFTLGDWNAMLDFRMDDSEFIRKTNRPYVFRVSVTNFVPLSTIPGVTKQNVPSLKHDKTMVCCHDYETYGNKPTGNAPVPEAVFDSDGNELDVIFMAGITYHWHYSADPIMVVNITSLPVAPRKDCIIIQVEDQTDIIKLEALMISLMAPDIYTGFNDGMYDNPFMFKRAQEYDKLYKTTLVEWIRKYTSCVTYNDETSAWLIGGPAIEDKIKVEADQYISNEFINNQGLLSIDTRTVFRQINPTGESSLNFFLKKYKLELKEDMEYTTMFRIYHLWCRYMELYDTREYDVIMNNLKHIAETYGSEFIPLSTEGRKTLGLSYKPRDEIMLNDRPWYSHIDEGIYRADTWTVTQQIELLISTTQVVHYCNIDSTRCIDLLIAGNVIPDKREVAILSYTNLYDGFYRAGGMKVRNLTISVGIKPEWNIAFDNASRGEKTDKKYPGAYVVPPKKKLSRDHTIIKRKRRKLAQANQNKENMPTPTFTIEEVSPDNPKFDKSLLKPPQEMQTERLSTDENEEIDRPCTGLDFSSLYPSLVMTYNLSPEKALRKGTNIEELYQTLLLKHPGKSLAELIHQCDFLYGFDDQDPKDKTQIEGKFVRHIPKPEIGPDGNPTGKTIYDGMGLYPFILYDLFNQRAVVKKAMDYYANPKEFMEKMISAKALKDKASVAAFLEKMYADRLATVEAHIGTHKEGYYRHMAEDVKKCIKFMQVEWYPEEKTETFDELYKSICFYQGYYNTKQLAIKVFMNTFYGETGNAISPFFIVEVAGTITTSGRQNIHMVKDFVEAQKYRVDYGDTDSLYICCPESCFVECDDDYLAGRISRLEYWTRMIEITMETIDKFKDDVNNLLFRDNGTKFLKMAYEEVLFPYAMVGKKKYIGIKHEGIVNLSACLPTITPEEFMNSRSLFVRGLEIKKRGASQVMKIIVFSALRDLFNLSTTRTMCDIFENKLSEISNNRYEPKLFVRTAKYKLAGQNELGEDKRGNVTVLEFVARMKRIEAERPDLGIKCPELGERFEYIVARKDPYRFDIRGRKHALKVGEKYEMFKYFDNKEYHRYLGGPIVVDTDYYMKNEISGQFARFLVYHPKYDKFCKDDLDPSLLSDEEYKEADKAAVNFAKKELQNYYDAKYAHVYDDHGDYYKKLYKAASQNIDRGLRGIYGDRAFLFKIGQNITTDTDDSGEYSFGHMDMRNALTQKLCAAAKKEASKGVKQSICKFLNKAGAAQDPSFLYKVYVTGKDSINKLTKISINTRIDNIQKEIDKISKDFQEICLHNTSIMAKLIDTADQDVRSSVLPIVPAGSLSQIELEYFQKFTNPDYVPEEDEVPAHEMFERANHALDILFDYYNKLVALYRSEVQMEEIILQLNNLKDIAAGITTPKPKDVKVKDQLTELTAWLTTNARPAHNPLVIKTSVGNIDILDL